MGSVHVKDVALAHILLYENPSASGRHLCVEAIAHFSDFAAKVAELYPEYKIHQYGIKPYFISKHEFFCLNFGRRLIFATFLLLDADSRRILSLVCWGRKMHQRSWLIWVWVSSQWRKSSKTRLRAWRARATYEKFIELIKYRYSLDLYLLLCVCG